MQMMYPTKWGVLVGTFLSVFFWILIIWKLNDFDAWMYKILKIKRGYPIEDSPTPS